MQDIIHKDIGNVCRRYEKNERLYMHKISYMEKVMPSFEYEPFVLSQEPETSNEEEDKRNIDGVGPSSTRIIEEEPGDLRGGKDRPKKEANGKTYASKQTLEPIKFVVQNVSSQEYASIEIKIRE